MGESTDLDPYHIPVIRGTMTRSLATVFPEVRDEVQVAFKEYIPPSTGTSKGTLQATSKVNFTRLQNGSKYPL